ncbi:hypothetical protein G4B88_021012 [Cannabis sativa]|uniref:RNA helicase n=1 Tax=Cannabis sativa TaxID=3483 RepID=A0A7J6GCL6_CANSA|nr:hypothetical protein G4B88_021012 [Cannabis sativa]
MVRLTAGTSSPQPENIITSIGEQNVASYSDEFLQDSTRFQVEAMINHKHPQLVDDNSDLMPSTTSIADVCCLLNLNMKGETRTHIRPPTNRQALSSLFDSSQAVHHQALPIIASSAAIFLFGRCSHLLEWNWQTIVIGVTFLAFDTYDLPPQIGLLEACQDLRPYISKSQNCLKNLFIALDLPIRTLIERRYVELNIVGPKVKLRLIPIEPFVGAVSWAFVQLPKIKFELSPFRLFNFMGYSGAAVMLYDPRRSNFSKIERESGVKFEHISTPQPADVAKAAGIEAAEILNQISDSVIPAFKAAAEDLLNTSGLSAVELLSKALAKAAGYSEIKSRSLLTSMENCVTVLLEAGKPIYTPS